MSALAIMYVFSGHKLSTLPVFLSAVNNWNLSVHNQSIPRGFAFQCVRKGLENIFSADAECVQAVGITLTHLTLVRQAMKFTCFEDYRDWCCLIFGFFGVLRVGEYCNGALAQRHVAAFEDRVELTIPYSKTANTPVVVVLAARGDILCPVKAYKVYVSLIGDWRKQKDIPFFLASSASKVIAVSDSVFINSLRSHLRVAGVQNYKEFSGHSLRRGGFSAMIEAGVPVALAQLHGRWKSAAYMRYIDVKNSLELRKRPTALLAASPSRHAATL